MKNKLLHFLTLIMIFCLSLGVFIACNNGGGSDNGGNEPSVKQISSSLLNGKVANLMGAEGFGIIDKTIPEQKSSPSVLVTRVYADENLPENQKKTEFAKETENGYKDVHFHKNEGNGKGYKDLNKKFSKHHHKGYECPKVDCDEISDEIEDLESSNQAETILSLNARVNKLYNYKNFTFMSISSAVEGKAKVLVEVYNPYIDKAYFENSKLSPYPTAVNIENHYRASGGEWEFGYIKIDSDGTNPSGYIPMKINENETGYHTANYWSDNYNQSYIIDNSTGITYSLAQFPYIYSVDKGIIKVVDFSVKGYFRYYKPIITQNQLTFEEIKLPTDQDFLQNLPPCGTSNSVMMDIYGNMLFNATRRLSGDVEVDEFGEKKYGDNVILALANNRVYQELLNKNQYGFYADIFANRYLNSNRYHLASDGKIYRVDFRGILSKVKVHVLGPNAVWQEVDSLVNVTFDNFNGSICWSIGIDKIRMDFFRINKIENGYAYYSTACYSDGCIVWDSVAIDQSLIEMGDYVGVIKLPVDGANTDNANLELMQEFTEKGINYNKNFTVFLVGKTQMLYHKNDMLFIVDVQSGKSATLSSGMATQNILLGVDRNNLIFSVNGQRKYLNVLQPINLDDFENSLSNDYVILGGELDAYFKFVTNK